MHNALMFLHAVHMAYIEGEYGAGRGGVTYFGRYAVC